MAVPTVSVVVPCYNVEEWVEEAISSVFAQTHPPIEVICVDDGSTDGTLGVLQRLQEQSEADVTVLTGPNGGPSVARNRGMAVAGGDYVQFLDADDLLQPRKIEHQVGLIEASGMLPDLVAAAYKRMVLSKDWEEMIGVDPDPWVGVVIGRLGITSSNLYRREAVQCVGGWNESLETSEDPELAFRLLVHKQNVLLDTVPHTTLRRREESQWKADLRASLRGWLRLRMQVVESMRARGLLTRERREVIEYVIFQKIRSVYDYDPDLAASAYDVMISLDFRPPPKEHGKAYGLLYGALGFRWTQRVYPYWLHVSRLGSPLRALTPGPRK